MSFTATVLRCMIASPSDTTEARDAVENAINGWNVANAHKGIVLLPWRWETAAVPVLGDHPQSLINAQGVDNSDIVFALFGGRLGSPSPEAVSGTVEEIERALNQGKPVHLYFSTESLPHDVDTTQLEGLRAFKEEIRGRGLLGQFSSASELSHEVWKAIELDLATLSVDASEQRSAASGVSFQVQPHQEREPKGVSKTGKMQYSTRNWVEVTNVGSADAENVLFEAVGDSGLHLPTSEAPTVVHAGQTRRVALIRLMGGTDPEIFRIRWTGEDGEPREKDFHIG